MNNKSSNSGIVYNMLASGSKIKGEFTADSDFRIDGTFEGNINCNGKVVIGINGLLTGNLVCTNAEVMGTIDGTVTVSDMLSIKSTAKVKGEIKTKTLMIEPNAIFCGSCDMSTPPTKPEKK